MQVTDTNTGWVSSSVTVTITDDLRIDSVSGCTSEPGSGTADCLPGATVTVLGAGFTLPASLGLYAAVFVVSPFSSTGGPTGSASGHDFPLGLSLAELIAVVVGSLLVLTVAAVGAQRCLKQRSVRSDGPYEEMSRDEDGR